MNLYRVIYKSLRDFWPLWHSRQDGHAEGEHVNRGRDTPSFCPTLQVLHMSTLGDAADVCNQVPATPVHYRSSEIPEGLMNYPVQQWKEFNNIWNKKKQGNVHVLTL